MVLDRLGAWIKRVRKEEGGRQVERPAVVEVYTVSCVCTYTRALS